MSAPGPQTMMFKVSQFAGRWNLYSTLITSSSCVPPSHSPSQPAVSLAVDRRSRPERMRPRRRNLHLQPGRADHPVRQPMRQRYRRRTRLLLEQRATPLGLHRPLRQACPAVLRLRLHPLRQQLEQQLLAPERLVPREQRCGTELCCGCGHAESGFSGEAARGL